MAKPVEPTTRYRWTDDRGEVHIVDDASKVPEAYRGAAEALVVKKKKRPASESKPARSEEKAKTLQEKALEGGKELQHSIEPYVPAVGDLDLPSAAFGFGVAIALVVATRLWRSGLRLLLKVAVVAAVLAMLAGGYFGAVRRSAGLGGGKVSSPATLLEDAKKARDAVNERTRQQKKILEKIEESTR